MKQAYQIAMDENTSASNRLRAAKFIIDVYLGKDPLIQVNIAEKPKEIDAIFEVLRQQDSEGAE